MSKEVIRYRGNETIIVANGTYDVNAVVLPAIGQVQITIDPHGTHGGQDVTRLLTFRVEVGDGQANERSASDEKRLVHDLVLALQDDAPVWLSNGGVVYDGVYVDSLDELIKLLQKDGYISK